MRRTAGQESRPSTTADLKPQDSMKPQGLGKNRLSLPNRTRTKNLDQAPTAVPTRAMAIAVSEAALVAAAGGAAGEASRNRNSIAAVRANRAGAKPSRHAPPSHPLLRNADLCHLS